jgi:hypothetical protein
MNGNLAQFGKALRLHLLQLRRCLLNIEGLFVEIPAVKDADLAERLQELNAATQQNSERTALLRETIQRTLDQEAALAPATISKWVGGRRTAKLHARADLIEQLATDAVEFAFLSALQAERITVEAIRARREAVSVQVEGNHRA